LRASATDSDGKVKAAKLGFGVAMSQKSYGTQLASFVPELLAPDNDGHSSLSDH
jgi:hypothetical protein